MTSTGAVSASSNSECGREAVVGGLAAHAGTGAERKAFQKLVVPCRVVSSRAGELQRTKCSLVLESEGGMGVSQWWKLSCSVAAAN